MKTISEITTKIGISQLNEMQQATIETIINTKNDLMILSPTGSGKTLAYMLPLVQAVNVELSEVQAIIVVPGRELALQSLKVLDSFGTGIRGFACYGGHATMDEHRQIRKICPQLIFTTPGRMNDHLDKRNINPHFIRWIILDEFDKCLEMGFQDEMSRLVAHLPRSARQIFLSATPAEEMRSQTIFRNQFVILDFISKNRQVSDRVHIYTVQSKEKDKLEVLARLLCQLGDGSSIVFLNYRDAVERTSGYLQDRGFSVSTFHGGLEQKEREAELYVFSNGSTNILVSTDLASRGLDIPNIKNIIHYHLPESEDGYIHRVGRTARWDALGDSYFILGPGETIPSYVNVETDNYVLSEDKPPIPVPKMATIYIGKGKKDKVSKGDIVGLLCKKAGLQSDEIGLIDVRDYYAYVSLPSAKVSETLKKLSDEKIKGLRTRFELVKMVRKKIK